MGLVHYPVYNRNREIIASAITTFDLHDLSRLARTYGVRKLYVVTPLKDQQVLAERIFRHWTAGYGAQYNPDRKEAMELAVLSSSLDEAVDDIAKEEGRRPYLVSTAAAKRGECALTYPQAKEILASGCPLALLFGTAWGLEKSVIERSDYLLEPVAGPTGYNHLSVRSAAAIVLDRLRGCAFGERLSER